MFNMLSSFFFLLFFFVVYGDFRTDFEIVFGGDRVKIAEDGNLIQLSLDQQSGSGFKSKDEYLFGKLDMQIKLVPGDSAGTVVAYYLSSSSGDKHDEIDFEFLGNKSGEPYVVQTNIYTQGKGDREQRFYLWFDPRDDFHTYSLLWNPHQILFSIDETPVSVFRNAAQQIFPYPEDQPMRLFATIWNASWATRGGAVQVDWNHAPFTASYRRYEVDACVWMEGRASCSPSKARWWDEVVDGEGEKKLKIFQDKYMIYNYCTDIKRFPRGLPPECTVGQY